MITVVTDGNYQQEVSDYAGRVLIDFYTPNCPPCRAVVPTLEQIASEQAALKVVKIDASTEFELATRFGVTAVPTFVLLSEGATKAQLTGLRSKKDFEKWLADN